jgi:hypothetical protein
MSDSRLGDRIDVEAFVDEDLPYPGQEPPTAFSAAESMDAPFGVTAGKSVPTSSFGLDVGSYEPTKPTAKVEKPTAPAKAEKPTDKEPPHKAKPTAENMSVQLRKFREAFGVKRISTKSHTITRRSADDSENVSITFQLRALNYEDYQWAIVKASDYSKENNIPLMFAWHFASVAISVCAFDVDLQKEARPTPVYEIFGIQADDPTQIRDPYYPVLLIRTAAADMFFQELVDTFYDVIQELHSVVEEYLVQQSQTLQKEKEEQGPLA